MIDIDQMCLLVDSLQPDEQREVYSRRGYLNIVNPLCPDRYYRLDLAVWDEREMAKILIRLVSCCGVLGPSRCQSLVSLLDLSMISPPYYGRVMESNQSRYLKDDAQGSSGCGDGR